MTDITIELGRNSDRCKEMQDAFDSGATLTIDHGGKIYTGCRPLRADVNRHSITFVISLGTPILDCNLGEIEQRVIASQCGDPCDMTAMSYYDADEIPARKSMTEKYGKLTPAQKRARLAEAYGMGTKTFRDMERGRFPFMPAVNPHKGDEMKSWKFKSTHPVDIDFQSMANDVTRQDPIAIVKGTYTAAQIRHRPKRDDAGDVIMRDVFDPELDVDAGGMVHKDTATDPQRPGVPLLAVPVPVMEAYTEKVQREENYVVIHDSLYVKSLVTAIDPPLFDADQCPIGVDDFMQVGGDFGVRVYTVPKVSDFGKWIAWAKEVKAAEWNDEDRRKAKFTVTLPRI